MSDRLVAEAPGPGPAESRTGPTGSGTSGRALRPRGPHGRPRPAHRGLRGGHRRPAFGAELDALRRDYAGRPTPLFPARRLSDELGLRVWLKREDLLHTGAHKLNNSSASTC